MASSQPAKGCFKCGGTGHWARDCPADPKPDGKQEGLEPKEGQREWKEWKAPTGKKKQAFDILGPKRIFTRPKLTEDVLLSKDKGIGYILKEFPRLMEIKGRGHEVGDLRRLLELYQRWHKMIFPSVAYGDFVEKVEKLGAKKRVRSTIRDLRHRIVHGEDDAFEPADVEPTAWGTAWEQQIDQAEAAEADGGEDGRPDTAPNDWTGASGAPGGGFSGAGMDPNSAPERAPAQTSGGLTAEQRARIEANKARALALRREKAAQAAEGRAAGGEAAAFPETNDGPPPFPAPVPKAKSMRQRLADDTDDDDDVIREKHDERAVPEERPTAVSGERSAAAQQKRSRKEMLDKLAERRGVGTEQDSEESGREEEEFGRRRRRKRPNSADDSNEPDGGEGSAGLNGREGRPDDGEGRSDNEERPNPSNGSDSGADRTGAASEEVPLAEESEDTLGRGNQKRRRLLKSDGEAKTGAQNGLEDMLMDDVEAPAARAPLRGKRQVVIESDDDE